MLFPSLFGRIINIQIQERIINYRHPFCRARRWHFQSVGLHVSVCINNNNNNNNSS